LFVLSIEPKDNCFRSKTGAIGLVRNVVKLNDELYIVYANFKKIRHFFEYPVQSSKVDIFYVSEINQDLMLSLTKDIECKCICLPDEDGYNYLVVPLLHCS